MPRPGPRPYECVRRAWHSERHQPIRGSLIQEIFRIANEIHSPETKKKKEWQEKLPIVVLKAEEILYSKANSEAEYMDLKTLWDRANDAINTIIRRDEGSEDTGEFLQPCIEAALHLGCIPRRASRSQRNNHPRGYLSGNPDLTNVTEANPKPTSSLSPHYSNFLGKEPQNVVFPIKSCLNTKPFMSTQNNLAHQVPFRPQSFAVYPLYYGAYSQPMEPQLKLGDQPNSVANAMNKTDLPKARIDQPVKECDLSLRLGFSPMQEDKDAHLSKKVNVLGSKQMSKEIFPLYHENITSTRDEFSGVDLMARKRKAVDQLKDPRHSWEPKCLSGYSKERAKTAG
ncbi:CREB-binding protein [Bienertia sinuspersici]